MVEYVMSHLSATMSEPGGALTPPALAEPSERSDMPKSTCSVGGCDAAVHARGWCPRHYHRWYRTEGRDAAALPPPQPCSIEGCDRPKRARGWCNSHYMRWLNHGDVMADRDFIDMKPGTPIERLLRRITKSEDGCWIYTGSRINTGYGTIHVEGKPMLTHRLSYEHHVGPIPEGLDIDHLCRVRACCNPDHLEPVTVAENNRRARQWSNV